MKEYTEAEKEAVKQAKLKAMHILEFSDKTEKQLRDKLKEGEFPPFAIDEAISYVQSYHYLDDTRFAETYIRQRRDRKSRYELREELLSKGIDRETIDLALEEAELSEEDTIRSLFEKKYGNKDLSDPKIYEKAVGYFMRKGYSYESVKRGIRACLEEWQDEE